jgi:DNA (cytosine-5)-methyltransferase 1
VNVLSLFDGISCGRVALERAGIEVGTYYASEVEPKAIEVSKLNNPDIIHLGDVSEWKDWDIDWGKIDLIMGGSPCQGFSSSGKMLNFEDPRSKLFFTYVDIVNHVKSVNKNVKFFLENVKMKDEWTDVISDKLGVDYVEINSSIVSAQNRVRLYWFNWNWSVPKDKNIWLEDILEDNVYIHSAAIRTRPIASEGGRKSLCLEVNERKKSLCLLTVNLNNLVSSLPKGRYLDVNSNSYPRRNYSLVEMCRLQTLPDNYVSNMSLSAGAKLLGNAWTVDVVAHLLRDLKATIK